MSMTHSGCVNATPSPADTNSQSVGTVSHSRTVFISTPQSRKMSSIAVKKVVAEKAVSAKVPVKKAPAKKAPHKSLAVPIPVATVESGAELTT